jgi:uncharacterized protein
MSKMNKCHKGLILIVLCFVQTLNFGQNIPAKPSPIRFVNDYAQLLSAQEQTLLENQLTQYFDTTTNQIVIVTLPTLGTNDMVEYSVSLFREWGIGTKERNNGVLILVCTDSTNRQARITTGYGMEGVLPDMICKRIVDRQLVPNLQKKAYYKGFANTFQHLTKYISGEYKAKKGKVKEPAKPLTLKQKILVALFILFYLFAVFFKIMNGGGHSVRRGGKLKWRSSSSRIRIFGGGSSGGGGAGSSW